MFLEINLVNTKPSVSRPRERGVTSNRRMTFTSPFKTPSWMASIATASSGFTELEGSLPKTERTTFVTIGILVMPPTSRISLISSFFRPASLVRQLGVSGRPVAGQLNRKFQEPTLSCSSCLTSCSLETFVTRWCLTFCTTVIPCQRSPSAVAKDVLLS